MSYFHFERLINKYSRNFTVILPTEGAYDDSGEYVKGEPQKKELSGAILKLSEKKIRNSNGTLTEKDYQLYIIGTMTNEIVGTEVIFEGNRYKVEDDTENCVFTGFSVHILKYISAFKGECE